MPYTIEKKGSEWCVKNSDTGEELKCYAQKSKALKYLQALEANVSDAKAQTSILSEGLAELDPAMITKTDNPEYPLAYQVGEDGEFRLIHRSRIVNMGGIEKAGRVLNAANAERLVNALGTIQSAQATVVEVLAGAGIELPDGESEDEPADDNEPEESDEDMEEKARLFTQEEAAYVILSPEVGKACANCRWFNGNNGGYYGGAGECQIVENYPEPITLTGLSNKWELREPYKPQPMEVVVVTEGEKDRQVQAQLDSAYQEPGIIAKAWAAIKAVWQKEGTYPFELVDVGEGKTLWLATYSNIFEDYDKEILSTKGHEQFIWRLENRLVPMPELWVWHTKGSRHGQADRVIEHGGMVNAIGHFDDNEFSRDWIKFYRKHWKEQELSHGFLPNLKEFRDGVFNDFNTFEISTLPPGAAANPYTQFEEVLNMALTDVQKAHYEAALGKEKAKQFFDSLESNGANIKALGAKYKDFAKPPEVAKDETPNEVEKSYAELMLETQAGLGDVVSWQDGIMAKAVANEAAIAEIKEGLKPIADLQAAVAELNKKLGNPPRRATQDSVTVVSPEVVKEVQDGQEPEYDTFFGDGKVKKGAVK